jgi:hypothetical protein
VPHGVHGGEGGAADRSDAQWDRAYAAAAAAPERALPAPWAATSGAPRVSTSESGSKGRWSAVEAAARAPPAPPSPAG